MIPVPGRLTPRLVIGIGCVLLLALLIHDRNRWKARTAHYAQLFAGEQAAHSATIANVRAATERARRQDAENADRVKAEQAAINERSTHEFESRIAAARAAAERLRRTAETATADPSRRGAAPVPALSPSSGGSAQAASEDGFPDADKRAGFPGGQLGAGDALVATEQAIQLDELINWDERQHAIDPSGNSMLPR